ncbi:MAG TPA: histidine kinase, partial [Acidobacteriota bacterium]
ATLTPAVLWLSHRFPLEKPRLPLKLMLHFFYSAVCYLIVSAGFSAGMFMAQSQESYWAIWSKGLQSFAFALDVLIYWTIVAVHHAIRYYRQHQKTRFTAAQLELKLLQSQLQALHMQLHPHFLFNTLHSISELIHEDVPAAKQMLERLIHFLRFTLENSSLQQVPLEKELEFLECYLQIQQVRFQQRLTVKMEIDDGARMLLVPNLVLQPIVENAIRYGIAPRTDSGLLEIKAGRKNGTLQLEVRDDGPGLGLSPLKEGLGLSNTRTRLQQMFGKAQSMKVQNAPEGGLRVILEMPVQTKESHS